MSSNLDLVRSIHSDWERGDYAENDWAHPAIEWLMIEGPTPGRWSGLAGMAEGFREFVSAWSDYRQEAEEYREIDSERVLVLAQNYGRGKASGVDLAPMGQTANLFHIHRGKVTKLVVYWSRSRAFADLGLAPGDDSAAQRSRRDRSMP